MNKETKSKLQKLAVSALCEEKEIQEEAGVKRFRKPNLDKLKDREGDNPHLLFGGIVFGVAIIICV